MTKKTIQRAPANVGLIFTAYNWRRTINIIGIKAFRSYLLAFFCVYWVVLVALERFWWALKEVAHQLNMYQFLYLILNDLIDIPILYLSSYIIENKPDYYRLLNQTNKIGEWEDWILFMLKAVETTSIQTIEKINTIRKLLNKTIEKVQTDAPKIYKKELVELLFEQPYSKIEFVVNKLKVERKAASRYLKELENIGVLEFQKVGRETLYINKKLIEALKKQST